MPYRSLYTPISQFVDPMSTEISNLLRERYLLSRAGMSELQQSMAELTTAPFDQDKKLKYDLASTVFGEIDSMMERGDLENMNLRVMSLADRYTKTATVLQRNAAAYQAYTDKLDKAYEEDAIDYEHYKGNLALSRAMYTGLQPTEYGGYGNYFQGLDIVTDPKIQELIDEALGNLKATKISETNASVGSNVNGEFTGTGMYDMKTKVETETITPDQINTVLDGIFRDPKVQAYLDRTAQIRMLGVDDKAANSVLNETANQYAILAEKYREASTNRKNKASDREQYAALADEYAKQAMAYSALRNASLEDRLSEVNSLVRTDLEDGYRNMAIANYARQDITTEIDRNYDPVWLERAKGNLQGTGAEINVRQSGAIEIDSSLGTTYEDLNAAVDGYTTANKSLQSELERDDLSDVAKANIQTRIDANDFFIDLAEQIREQQFANFDPSQQENFEELNSRLQAYKDALDRMQDPNRIQYGPDPIGSASAIKSEINDLQVQVDRLNAGRNAVREVQTKIDALSTTTIPGLNAAENKALFAELKSYFGGGIDNDLSVYVDDEGAMMSYGELLAQNPELKEASFASVEALYNFAPIGSPALVIRMADESGITHPIFIPMTRGGVNQIQLSNLDAAMNTNTFRLISSAQIAAANNLSTYKAPIYIQTPTSKQKSSIEFDVSDKSNIRAKLNGKWTDVTDPEFLQFIEDNHIVPLYHNNYE